MSKNRFGVEVPEIQIPDYDGSYNKTVQEAIKQAKLEVIEKIRPFLMKDGGDVQFVKFENGVVYIKMLGACSDCISQDATINEGIQIILQEEVPGVVEVKVISPYEEVL